LVLRLLLEEYGRDLKSHFKERETLEGWNSGIASFRRSPGQANELDSALHQVAPSEENRMFGQIASKCKKCKLIAATVRTLLIAATRNILPYVQPLYLWTMSTTIRETRQHLLGRISGHSRKLA
jgi:hypothetical protein